MIGTAPRLGPAIVRPYAPRRNRRRQLSPLHAMDCACPKCAPQAGALRWTLRILAALAIGQLLTVALDAAIGGPGPFVLFGF